MAGIKLAGESDGPTTLGSWGHRALLVDGEPPRREIFSHSPTHRHKHKWDEQVGLPPPAPESRTSIANPLPNMQNPNPNTQPNQHPPSPLITPAPEADSIPKDESKWVSSLSLPLGKDISKMHCIFDMSIKQGGRVGLRLIPG